MRIVYGSGRRLGTAVVRDGEPVGAYRELFEAHGPALRRYAHRFVRSAELAEDVVQDVFLGLWLAWDRVEIGSGTRSYLFTATRTRALSQLRRLRSEQRRGSGEPAETSRTDDVVSLSEHEARDRAHRIVVAIEQVLAGMPPRQREVAALRLWWQRTTPEIAAVLGISTRTVELHVGRAMKTLRARLPAQLEANDA